MAKIIIIVETKAFQDEENVSVKITGDHPDMDFNMSQLEVLKYVLYAVVTGTITDHPTLNSHVLSTKVTVEK